MLVLTGTGEKMTIFFSEYATVLRQYTTGLAGLTGVAPVGPAVVPADPDVAYLPESYTKGVHTYCNPGSFTLVDLTDGGIFDPGLEVPFAICTIHAKLSAGGTITLSLVDRVSGEYVTVISGAAAVNAYFECGPTTLVVPENYVKVVTNRPGTIDIYCSRIDWHR